MNTERRDDGESGAVRHWHPEPGEDISALDLRPGDVVHLPVGAVHLSRPLDVDGITIVGAP